MDNPKGRAQAKIDRGEASCGVAAAVVKETTAPDRDGRTWQVLVTDGQGEERIAVEVGDPYASSLDDGDVEAAVESLAGDFPSEGDRLAMLAASAPHTLLAPFD